MSVSVTVTGVPEVKARLQILKGEVLARTRKAIAATAVGVERRAKENLTSVGPSGYDAVDTGLARAGIHAVYPTAEKGMTAKDAAKSTAFRTIPLPGRAAVQQQAS